MREHKQKMVSAMMHHEEAATETAALPPANLPTLPAIYDQGVCEVLFTIHESVLNPFEARSLLSVIPASTIRNPTFFNGKVCLYVVYSSQTIQRFHGQHQ